MVTLNYYRMLQARLSGAWQEMVCVDGVSRVISDWGGGYFADAMTNFSESLTSSAGICLLDEDNVPNINSYTVSGVIVGHVSMSPPAQILWGVNNNCIEGTVTLGLLGLADNTTIKGIALMCRGKTASEDSQYNILFDVTPLDTPIVINQGETKQLTYTIRINATE